MVTFRVRGRSTVMAFSWQCHGAFHGTPEDNQCHQNPWLWPGLAGDGGPFRFHTAELRGFPCLLVFGRPFTALEQPHFNNYSKPNPVILITYDVSCTSHGTCYGRVALALFCLLRVAAWITLYLSSETIFGQTEIAFVMNKPVTQVYQKS